MNKLEKIALDILLTKIKDLNIDPRDKPEEAALQQEIENIVKVAANLITECSAYDLEEVN